MFVFIKRWREKSLPRRQRGYKESMSWNTQKKLNVTEYHHWTICTIYRLSLGALAPKKHVYSLQILEMFQKTLPRHREHVSTKNI